MSYQRVIPRDLFNEGNLLKCYGQLYLNLERMRLEDCLVEDDPGDGFLIEQNDDSGGISIVNLHLTVRGKRCDLERPLNSRDPYPLYLRTEDHEIQVFQDDGAFTEEMTAFLRD